MEILRKSFDAFYDAIKPAVFWATKKDPEKAHELFVNFCRFLHTLKLERIVLNNPSNKKSHEFKISNAAGFNKNGEIHPNVLKYLGFDRAVIGTVTYDEWKGNPRPRTKRFPETESLVNWMGLPGIGADRVAETVYFYGKHSMPLTVNIMATPGKQGDELLRDLKDTVDELKYLRNIDRFELNVSCPNTHLDGKIDARNHYQSQLSQMLYVVFKSKHDYQSCDVKVSPDLDEAGIEQTVEVLSHYPARAVVTANTSTNHLPEFIPDSPGKGGASGNAVYPASLRTQTKFYDEIHKRNLPLELVACGGINSLKRAAERLAAGAEEIQIYTPLIFKGTKILREFREM